MSSDSKERFNRQEAAQASDADVRRAILTIFEECAADPYGFARRELEAHERSVQKLRKGKEAESSE